MKDLRLPALHEMRVGAHEHSELAAFGINRVGLTVASGAYTRESRVSDHKVAHVQVLMRGRAEVKLPTGWVTWQLNSPYSNPLGANWGWRYSARDEPMELLYVRLVPSKSFASSLRQGESFLISNRSPEDLMWTFRRLYRETVTANRTNVIRCLAELIAIHTWDLVQLDNATNFLADLWVTVLANLQKNWTVINLAESMDMSPEALRLLCHKECGRSPMQQVTHLRMRKASQLLKETTGSIEQISYQVGYQNPFGFSTAFRRWFGKSPRSFRLAK